MGKNSHEQFTLLTDYDTDSAYSEAFHTLFANVLLNWDRKQVSQLTLSITTPVHSAEQAGVAANLALAAAQTGTPTILVDANLRYPSLQQRFGLGSNLGLADLLTEEVLPTTQIEACLSPTFVPGLRVLCAGSLVKPAGLSTFVPGLEGLVTRLRQFLAEKEAGPGIVIFASAAVLDGPDASLISSLADQTLLAVVNGRNTRAQVKSAQEQLQRARANLVGVIMVKP